MTPPAPAAVRCALTKDGDVVTPGELLASVADKRPESQVLRDHIRAVAAEMRAKAKATRLNTVDPFMSIAVRNAEISEAQLLERFADRLEGRES